MTERRAGADPLHRAAVPAVASQAVFAANSLILTLVAGWRLDSTSFGHYAILFGAFALVGALSDALLGEARVVLGSEDDGVQGALLRGQLAVSVVAGIGCGLLAATTGLGTREAAAAIMAGTLWSGEAGMRRVLSAQLAFGSLIANDLSFLGAAIVVIAAVDATATLTLGWVLLAWAAGAASSMAVGLLQVGADERRFGCRDAQAIRHLLSFGSWRVVQALLRPLCLLAVRVMVGAVDSPETVAKLELARLPAAPISVVSAGMAQLLLPRMARAAEPSRALTVRAGRLLGAFTLSYSALIIGASVLLEGRLGFIQTDLEPEIVGAWVLVGLSMSCGLPAMTWLIARRHTLLVFRIRAADNLVGLLAAGLLVSNGAGAGALYGVGISGMIGSAWIATAARQLHVREQRSTAPRDPSGEMDG